MAAEFVIATRLPLPGAGSWDVVLDNDDGEVEVYTPQRDAAFDAEVAKIVGFAPASIVCVRKAWDCAEVVAEVIATALDGAVYCDFDGEVSFDAAGNVTPVASRGELLRRMRKAFRNPEPYFERWAREARDGYNARVQDDPVLAAENDWSDV